MFFIENKETGGNVFKSFDIVNKRDNSRIKARPQYAGGTGSKQFSRSRQWINEGVQVRPKPKGWCAQNQGW